MASAYPNLVCVFERWSATKVIGYEAHGWEQGKRIAIAYLSYISVIGKLCPFLLKCGEKYSYLVTRTIHKTAFYMLLEKFRGAP